VHVRKKSDVDSFEEVSIDQVGVGYSDTGLSIAFAILN